MRHFHYRNLQELETSAKQEGADRVRFEADPEKVKEALGRKVRAGRFTIGNSMCIHPMEGCDGELDGRPGELTWRRYQRFAEGGSKLVWFEATAVREEARANTRQLWITPGNASEYARLIDRMRELHIEQWGSADDLLIPMQLTHSGRYSVPTRIIAYHNPFIDAKTATPPDYPVISDDELERLEDDYVAAARLALDAGFNSIDLKVTHGYLLAELMGAKTRDGRYGGSLENRCRIVRNIIGKIKAALGDRLLLVMRLGCFDSVPYLRDPATGSGVPCKFPIPYPHGWGVNPDNPLEPDLTEVKQAIRWFHEWGIALLNVSAGCPYYNPHIGRPFEKPDDGNYEQPEHPLAGVDRHFGIAAELQRSLPGLPMVGTGYSWLQRYAINAGAWNIAHGAVSMMGVGRNSLAYPDFARDALEKGELDEARVCKTLTYCTFLMRQKDHPLGQYPTGCPPFDKGVYGNIIKEVRAAKRAADAK
jgi:NADPH2 dehydrogenase